MIELSSVLTALLLMSILVGVCRAQFLSGTLVTRARIASVASAVTLAAIRVDIALHKFHSDLNGPAAIDVSWLECYISPRDC